MLNLFQISKYPMMNEVSRKHALKRVDDSERSTGSPERKEHSEVGFMPWFPAIIGLSECILKRVVPRIFSSLVFKGRFLIQKGGHTCLILKKKQLKSCRNI
jgi:hypothetical protein